jgi:hypothetical protein
VGANWHTDGNSNADPQTNFLGTLDGRPLIIRTNNVERLRVGSGGRVGIGQAPGTALLTVSGEVHSTSGGIRFPDGSLQTTAAQGGGTGASGGLTNGVREYTASGTFAVPANVTRVLVEAWGGGGGGRSGPSPCPPCWGEGGAGGGYVRAIVAVPPGATCTVTVGAGGAAGVLGGTQEGGPGGATTLDCGSGPLLSATGGSGGGTFGPGGGGTLPTNPPNQGIVRAGTVGVGGQGAGAGAGGRAAQGSIEAGGAGGKGGSFIGQIAAMPGTAGLLLIQW